MKAILLRGTIALAFISVLIGCAQPPAPFPDYCQSQNRTIPRDERIVAALTYAATNHHGRLPHFIAFRSAMRQGDNLLDDRRIAQAYLARFPDCCDVVRPWVVSEYYRNGSYVFGNDAVDSFFKEFENFHWSHDILIARVPPLNTADEPFRVQSSSCGRATRLRRG